MGIDFSSKLVYGVPLEGQWHDPMFEFSDPTFEVFICGSMMSATPPTFPFLGVKASYRKLCDKYELVDYNALPLSDVAPPIGEQYDAEMKLFIAAKGLTIKEGTDIGWHILGYVG